MQGLFNIVCIILASSQAHDSVALSISQLPYSSSTSHDDNNNTNSKSKLNSASSQYHNESIPPSSSYYPIKSSYSPTFNFEYDTDFLASSSIMNFKWVNSSSVIDIRADSVFHDYLSSLDDSRMIDSRMDVASTQFLRKTASSTDDEIIIYVLGDIPYDQNEAKMLSKQIDKLPLDAQFIFHVGDIMSSESGCPEEWYMDVKRRLLQSRVPVFITPGDNDWSDCPNPSEAWSYWKKHFNKFDSNWDHSIPIIRQNKRKENVSFLVDFALFIQVHLIGLPMRDPNEWKNRINDDIEFTLSQIDAYKNTMSVVVVFGHTKPRPEHDDFFNPLYEMADKLGKPVFYIHGDGHSFYVDNVSGVANMIDIEVDQGRKAPPLKVVIKKDAMLVAREY